MADPKLTGEDTRWGTALTSIEPNRILLRGYPLDEVMGRLSFGESIYLLLVGEVPGPAIGRLVEALLISFIDHGVTPPPTLAARNVTTTGAPTRNAVAAGVLGFGKFYGGDIQACRKLLDEGLALTETGKTYRDAAIELVDRVHEKHDLFPGFGHRYHQRDPRAARLFQMALELDLEGPHVQMIRALEMALHDKGIGNETTMPVNVDGAIAAVCADIGLEPEVADALFIISRIPGIIAHSLEEQAREQPMRVIEPSRHTYDGPSERRLPDRRK
ncbi:MAG: citryl-CoA lyase [Acidobacteriota bacterium]|nr:citryl-CoA lyase [Acidobacteriota bacterium]MDQ3170986.1 citryl-CoA lyase [Acidobacteriota bacterium]